jgi:uncharacterized protein YndB with AHSA1/START domain
MKAPANPPDALVFEVDFEEPPEKVWRALTEPRLLEAWLTGREPQRPGSGEGGPAPRPQPDGYEIMTAEPHRRLQYRWRDRENAESNSGGREVHSVVTVELAPGATGGTHLRLTHAEFKIVSAAPTLMSARISPIARARGRYRQAYPSRRPMLALAAPRRPRRAA